MTSEMNSLVNPLIIQQTDSKRKSVDNQPARYNGTDNQEPRISSASASVSAPSTATLECAPTHTLSGGATSLARNTADSANSNSNSHVESNSNSVYARFVREFEPHKLPVNPNEETCAEKRIGFYKMITSLGTGNFSTVKLGYHMLTREKVALKIIDKRRFDLKTRRLLSNEVRNMSRVHHPSLVALYDVYETAARVYIVQQLAAYGDLHTLISRKGALSEKKSRTIFAQILSAVQYMHDSCDIIHRDIKAENIFFSIAGRVKLGDFGFSIMAQRDAQLSTYCGSPPYAAPELFTDATYLGRPVDVWALGVLLFYMVAGVFPFRADTVPQLRRIILTGLFRVPDHVSLDCARLIGGLLEKRIEQRWTLNQITSQINPNYHHSPNNHHPNNTNNVNNNNHTTNNNNDVKLSSSFGSTNNLWLRHVKLERAFPHWFNQPRYHSTSAAELTQIEADVRRELVNVYGVDEHRLELIGRLDSNQQRMAGDLDTQASLSLVLAASASTSAINSSNQDAASLLSASLGGAGASTNIAVAVVQQRNSAQSLTNLSDNLIKQNPSEVQREAIAPGVLGMYRILVHRAKSIAAGEYKATEAQFKANATSGRLFSSINSSSSSSTAAAVHHRHLHQSIPGHHTTQSDKKHSRMCCIL